MRRFLYLILVSGIICCMIPTAHAADEKAVTAADTLYALGLFKGTGSDANGKPVYDLDRAPTRHEAVTMLVRILGKEEEALQGSWEIPFLDVDDWAKPYVGYAYAHGLTSGTSAVAYSGNAAVTASQYLTFILRALGYDSSTDFQWDRAWELSDALGLTAGEYSAQTALFTRGDTAIISAAALKQNLKGTAKTLEEHIRSQMKPAVDFSALLDLFSDKHRAMVAAEGAFDDFDRYTATDREAAQLLTKAEITSLLRENDTPETISYAAAAQDVDLLFRALRSAYGAYYYFGADAFDSAQAEIMDWLSGRTLVNTGELGAVIADAFSFLRDAHAAIVDKSYESQLRYKYHYCPGQNFQKDAQGYYRMIGGEKWYFKAFSDPRTRMEYTLTTAGEIVSSPVLFCIGEEETPGSVTLENGAGQTMTQTLNWRVSQERGAENGDADFTLLEQQGVAYLSILNFQSRCEADQNRFMASGSQLRDAKLIIFDLRSNGGGTGHYSETWVQNFCGSKPAVPQAYSERFSPLLSEYQRKNGRDDESGAYGTFEIEYTNGRFLRNDIPIIVLLDDDCGSAGESALNFLRSMENVLVVGSNSAGYQLSGNAVEIILPNSGLPADFGTTCRFMYSTENVDFKGYEPDIWCNPKTAVESVLNMLLRYDQIDASLWADLRESLAEKAEPSDTQPSDSQLALSLLFPDGMLVEEHYTFGTGVGSTRNATVRSAGNKISDYTASVSDTSICEVSVDSAGLLIITAKKAGECTLSITYRGQTVEFGYRAVGHSN